MTAHLTIHLTEKAGVDGHSTPSQAAAQAKAANAKRLALSHISARYPDASLLLEQAKKVFPNSILAEDYYGNRVAPKRATALISRCSQALSL